MKAFLKLLKCTKTNYLLFLILVGIMQQNLKAQYAIAGSTVGLYTNVPDTVIGGLSSDDEFYYIDINQDGTNDISFAASIYYYPTGGYFHHVGIGTVDSNIVKFQFLRKSTCNILAGTSSNMLRSYSYEDTIKRGNYMAGGYLVFDTKLANNPCTDHTFTFSTNAYIGVRYATNIDTAYGWIGVDVIDYGTVRIKDFALEKNPVVGIKEYTKNNLQFVIHPNPAQTEIHINTDEAEILEIKITSITGSELINTKQTIIDVSHLPNGIYFAQIKTNKGVGAKKIVVQR